MLRTKILLLAALLKMLACAAEAAELQPVLAGRPFLAVILPPENARTSVGIKKGFSDFWMPTVADVAMAEKTIAEFFATAETNEELSPSLRKCCVPIRDHPDRFIRQYVGGIRDGRRVILCVGNPFFPEYAGKYDDWRRRVILWYDSGTTWKIEYDMQDGVCRRFWHDLGY